MIFVISPVSCGSGDIHEILVGFLFLGAERDDRRIARTIVDRSGARMLDGVVQMPKGVLILFFTAGLFILFVFHIGFPLLFFGRIRTYFVTISRNNSPLF